MADDIQDATVMLAKTFFRKEFLPDHLPFKYPYRSE